MLSTLENVGFQCNFQNFIKNKHFHYGETSTGSILFQFLKNEIFHSWFTLTNSWLISFPRKLDTTVLPSRLNQSNFFDILLPLAKWNMIICLLRTFLENALKKQNFPFSPLSLHCACMSVGNSVFFFFKLAAPMHVLFFKVARSPFKPKYGILSIFYALTHIPFDKVVYFLSYSSLSNFLP